MTVRYLNVAHEVVVATEPLDAEPTAVMARLLDVLAAARRENVPVRVVVMAAGLSTEPL